MGKRVITLLTDDMTGEDLDDGQGETVEFSLDGQQYTVDLSNKNADTFRGLFQDYIAVAAKVGRRSGGRSASAARSQSGPSAKELREWARENKLDVPERGRIPAAVREAYDAAH